MIKPKAEGHTLRLNNPPQQNVKPKPLRDQGDPPVTELPATTKLNILFRKIN